MRFTLHPHIETPTPEPAHVRTGERENTTRDGANGSTHAQVLSPADRGFPTGPAQAPAGYHPQGSPQPGTSRGSVARSSMSEDSLNASANVEGYSMSLEEARKLVHDRGKAFDYPPFLNDDPSIPRKLTEYVGLHGMPDSVDDIPLTQPALREAYEAYAKKKETWHAQKSAYDHLYNRFTLEIAKMLANGAAPLDITKNRLKLGAYLDGEQKSILYNRNPERALFLKLDFDVEQHFLNKKEFHAFPTLWRGGYPWKGGRPAFEIRFMHPEDIGAIERLLEMKKGMEAQLQLVDKDPATTLDSMRDLHSKLQNRLDSAIDRAIANKKNRQSWWSQSRTLGTWLAAGMATGSTVFYAIEKYLSMAVGSIKDGNDNKDKDKNKDKSAAPATTPSLSTAAAASPLTINGDNKPA